MNSKKTRWLPPALTMLGFVILWYASLWFVPWVARDHFGVSPCAGEEAETCRPNEELLRLYGTTGDLFGAANALFGGLALAGVALTLWLQTRDRRRDARPLLIPFFDGSSPSRSGGSETERSGAIEITAPSLQHGSITLPIEIGIPILNQSNEAALNVSVRATLYGESFDAQLPVPIAGQRAQSATLHAELRGPNAKRLQTDLTARAGKVRLTLKLRYFNLDKIEWETSVTYMLSLDELSRERDAKLLSQTVDKSPSNDDLSSSDDAEGGWTKNRKIPLQAEAEGGSWEHKEAQ